MTDPLIKELIAVVVREEMKGTCSGMTMPQSAYCAKYDISHEAIRQRLQKGVWRMGHASPDMLYKTYGDFIQEYQDLQVEFNAKQRSGHTGKSETSIFH